MTDLPEDFAEEGPETSPRTPKAPMSDREIEAQFQRGRLRVIQEKNDFFLPHVVDFIEGRQWGNLRPEYQRRLRWDQRKKSKLIESFVMNVPVPPIFLYETTLGRFEVMDGQQRLNTIVEFLQNEFELRGLEIWPQLNGRRFSELPSMIKKGLERAKISAIILISDAGEEGDTSVDLRAQVFDRINSGGEQLNAQELRNSLYHGPFNDLLVDLAAWKRFTDKWGIPSRQEHVDADGKESDKLKSNTLYKRMGDTEIVLRFFAFRNPKYVRGSVKAILTETMKRLRGIDDEKKDAMTATYKKVFRASIDVFGDNAFKIQGSDGKWRLSRPLYDAQMIAIYRNRTHIEEAKAAASKIRKRVAEATRPESENYALVVGRANTADAIKKRAALFTKIVRDEI
ncbi:DUF262 domain-containing protein [Citromicrobium bathyomarinum]